ncbi:AfsR/SARP family transcriptional regulator, partial [Microbacterium sp.]|uniref:AfsR/SARP family transcriptional regulator n=1 Tax=Microbacterium sp. TaxID=51671 RepID=UPI003C75BD8D
MLELRWFGAPQVSADGVAVRFDTRKAVALLAYVSVTGRPVTRDALCELLWPDLDRVRARAVLRRTLSVAASAVPQLVVAGDTIALARAGIRCDATEFRDDVDSDDPARWRRAADAAGAAGGGFLEGFALRDAPPFEQWQAATAAGLRDDVSLVLGMLVTEAERAGRFADALGYARRRVDADPLAEPAHADLIRLLAVQGDRSGAFTAYRRLVEVLDSELGIAPLPTTRALLDEVRRGGARSRGVTTASVPVRSEGRSEEAAAVRRSELEDETAEVEHFRDAVESRLAGVGAMTRQVLEALVALGGESDAELLRRVAGRTVAETAQAIIEAERAGLAVSGAVADSAADSGVDPVAARNALPGAVAASVTEAESVRVAHVLVQTVVGGTLPLARLRLLHGRAAEALSVRAGAQP